MNPRLILAAFIITLGLIIAAVPENTTKQYKLTANQLLDEIKSDMQFISTDEVADMIINKDPSIQLIDVRSPDQFEKFSLPNAINIPLVSILSDEWTDVLDQDVKMNIFYSNGTLDANEAWMITRQLGYENNYVLQGGLNYWAETIMNPKAPKSTSPDDEFAKYDFRKGASAALGGATVSNTGNTSKKSTKPKIKRKKKKKRAAGGC
ncbi:MAG: rhodanese-like domain-containing protein [Chlorobi bacterium]|nr:rhodanese-like domain-containing protein [Chlorobiota bacterium]